MMGVDKPSIYYMPADLVSGAEAWIHSEAVFEGVPEQRFKLPEIVGLNAGERIDIPIASTGQHLPVRNIILFPAGTTHDLRILNGDGILRTSSAEGRWPSLAVTAASSALPR